jgi:hypothetical protein
MALLVIPHSRAYIISDNGQTKIVLEEYQFRGSQHNVVFFLILWFYSCTHIILIMRLIVLNDSIGGHIHIFRDVCFFLNPPLPSYCCI